MILAANVVVTSLGIVFLLAAIGKMRHPGLFAEAVRNYEILPGPLVPLSAAILIGVESFLATAFLTGLLIEIATPLAAATLLVFVAAVTINLVRKRSIPCGCFGESQERISTRTLIRLALLLLGVLLVGATIVMQGSGDRIAILEAQGLSYRLEMGCLAIATNLVVMWGLALPELQRTLHYRAAGAR
jgi:hypothetical protein